MEIKTPLEFGHYYHIYHRGNNGTNVFFETENYYHFLRLYAKYITPIADTYAWCLLKNHFHILVRIKEEREINSSDMTYTTTEKPKTIVPYRQFSHLFNAYTQAMNKRYKRTGSLFENKFERKLVTSERYFKQLVYYIHHNPVHHGFVKEMNLYPWSSYATVVSNQTTQLNRNSLLDWYGSKDEFVAFHCQEHTLNEIIDFIIEI